MARGRQKLRTRRGISLPWERQTALLRDLVRGKRWKVALLVVILGASVWVVYRSSDREERVRETRAAIAEVHRAIDAFRAEVGRCPENTDELLHPPRSARRFLRDMPLDGWDRELFVRCPALDDPYGAEVVSAGPSGSFVVDDNVR